ncbi:glycerol kinase GlpK [Telmatospirillum siberiense]|nr:glycerol kinase GlpK [Telmatospirillum siberiense]
MDCILAIDQGTTCTRTILFNPQGGIVATAQRDVTQHFPADGWVENDPEEIWQSVVDLCRELLSIAAARGWRVATIGIANQRETTIIWERATGRPIAPAIVWQDRRTARRCRTLIDAGQNPLVQNRTGLPLDPYFSASKIAWLLDNVPFAREAARKGDLAFGTIDCFLLWRLTGGAVHATDATNAARTMLFDIHRQRWDEELLDLFDIPAALLPDVRDNAADFGQTAQRLFPNVLTIGGMAGDQQAATVGQACFSPGMVKSTYGTGCFMVMNTGTTPVVSRHHLLTTLAYRLEGVPTYALEGGIFVAGATIQWLRDSLHLIQSAGQTEELAASLGSNAGIYFVPAFTGLGAPYWDPDARGAIFGLTRTTGIAEIVRAALEAVCYQTNDLLTAMLADAAQPITELRVDGGMAGNSWLMQFLADLLGIPVARPSAIESTAIGAACLAGLQSGLLGGLEDIAAARHAEHVFHPLLPANRRAALLDGWKAAIRRVTLPPARRPRNSGGRVPL